MAKNTLFFDEDYSPITPLFNCPGCGISSNNKSKIYHQEGCPVQNKTGSLEIYFGPGIIKELLKKSEERGTDQVLIYGISLYSLKRNFYSIIEPFLNDQAEEEDEICPCGHKMEDHSSFSGPCQKKHCDCPQFGEDPETYETHHIAYVGGDLMGFHVVE